MAFLVLGSVTVPVSQIEELDKQRVEIGVRERSFDGTMRSSVRARKDEWRILTRWMTEADADTLRTELENTPPRTATGDLVGTSTSVVCGELRELNRRFAEGERWRFEFTMMEE